MIYDKTCSSLHLAAFLIGLATGCAPEGDTTDEPGVEPALVSVTPISETHGSATLTVFVHPDADGSASVWLYTLDTNFTTIVANIETDVPFPLEVAPGELVRAPFEYRLVQPACDHKLSGTVYDDTADEFMSVIAPAVRVAGCN